jgi:CopG family transcriptional regulator / antitoxin EndoAI
MFVLTLDPMNKRINIVLPAATLQTINRLAKPGMRSKFIKTAVDHYITNRSTEALRAQLEHAAVRDQDLDREIAEDWFAVDKEAWQRLNTPKQNKSSRSAAKSTSQRSTRR